MKRFLFLLIGLAVGMVLFSPATWFDGESGFDWQLPKDVPAPTVPDNNPMSAAKVELGRHLFYDKRLSANNTIACASCHHQSKGFTDGEKGSTGLFGDVTPRNAMGLTNVAYNQNFTWANPLSTQLEHQARFPLFGETPAEMGLSGVEHKSIEQLKADPKYQTLFKQTYPLQQAPFTMTNIIAAIAAFERTLLSFNSPYDKYLRGENNDFGESEKRGLTLFFSEKSECFHCHGGFNFSDSSVHKNSTTPANRFHNNGLYNIDGRGAYPKSDRGLYNLTSHKDDMGKFKAPTLRNVAVTGPFMHDGSIETLEGVVDHYINGGTNIREGKNKGFGSANPFKSEFVPGLELTIQERNDLLSFLHSLTDETFLNNPDFSDPW
jgi:cytochrome c peroxidase